MKDYRTETENTIRATYGENAPYILRELADDFYFMNTERRRTNYDGKRRTDEELERVLSWEAARTIEKADRVNGYLLTPATAKVGDGATVHYYSDSHAGTIIKVTKKTITVQRDKATLDPNWKPEFIIGGFCAHCTSQSEQTYTYERNPDGETWVFHWSDKYNCYGQPGNIRATKGRREFYDYNF